MIYDDLPIFSFVGTVDDSDLTNIRYYLYNHIPFEFDYNGDQVSYSK